MLLLAGSALVKDSEGMYDLDVVYLTPNIGKYFLLLKLKNVIEGELSKKFNKEVTFSPYLILSPTLIGNLFLAITLARYPYKKECMDYLIRLTLAKRDRRWLMLHLAFSILGLISSKSCRDRRKYCSMLAENLLYNLGAEIPTTWSKTIKLGYALSSKLKLRHTSLLLLSCIKKGCSSRNLNVNIKVLKDVIEELEEAIVHRKGITLIYSLSNPLRLAHKKLVRLLFKRSIRWIECSSLMLILISPEEFCRVFNKNKDKATAITIFKLCRYEIPVLSPLAHP